MFLWSLVIFFTLITYNINQIAYINLKSEAKKEKEEENEHNRRSKEERKRNRNLPTVCLTRNNRGECTCFFLLFSDPPPIRVLS